MTNKEIRDARSSFWRKWLPPIGTWKGRAPTFSRALQTAHEPKVIVWSHIYLGRIYDLKEDRFAALDEYRAALNAAGGALPEAKLAAQRGLEQPYEPPVAKQPE